MDLGPYLHNHGVFGLHFWPTARYNITISINIFFLINIGFSELIEPFLGSEITILRIKKMDLGSYFRNHGEFGFYF